MAALLPGARLLYLVRDPVERALSQYHHHRAEGTEPRPLEEALLDPGSHYLAGRWPRGLENRRLASDGQRARPSPRLHRQLAEALRDDADRLRDLAGREYPAWSL